MGIGPHLTLLFIQVTKQINFGAVYSKRYMASAKLVPTSDGSAFSEITESQMIDLNLIKVNSYKNYKTRGDVNGKEEELFIEINLYDCKGFSSQNPVTYAARPAEEIDLK